LQTFFYQDISGEEETDVAWIGVKYNEYTELVKFLDKLVERNLMHLSDGLIEKLQYDQDHAKPLSPLQFMMKERFGYK
jgi:hypothetical protein